jgi:hypothetical protein
MSCNHQQLFLRDIIDAQLESADHRALGRVADIEVEVRENGCLALTALLTGPQAGAGRVAGGLRRVCAWVLRDRFESRIPLEEVHAFGPTIILRKQAREYQVGQSERWIVRHLLRWIPGSGD